MFVLNTLELPPEAPALEDFTQRSDACKYEELLILCISYIAYWKYGVYDIMHVRIIDYLIRGQRTVG
jgi:hypothetical protein